MFPYWSLTPASQLSPRGSQEYKTEFLVNHENYKYTLPKELTLKMN